MAFSVCNSNLGSDANDYTNLCKYLDSNFTLASKEAANAHSAKYQQLDAEAATALADQSNVYCFQEVGSADRPILKELKTRGFEIVHFESKEGVFDTAIALDGKRFKHIQNDSIQLQLGNNENFDIAIATATERESGQQFTFVSAHPSGMCLHPVEEDVAETGDNLCASLADYINSSFPNSILIMGMDMNASPETWSKRFDYFTNKGFSLHRTNEKTNVFPPRAPHEERELDYIFMKAVERPLTFWDRLWNVFKPIYSNWQLNMIPNPTQISWNVDTNPSDHIPIFARVLPRQDFSKIYQLWTYLFGTSV